MMCDGCTHITKISMIYFLVYYSKGIIFLKSIVNYIFSVMDVVVEEIGKNYYVILDR